MFFRLEKKVTAEETVGEGVGLPGDAVVDACMNPAKPRELLIAYEASGLVLWDLAKPKVLRRYDPPSGFSWAFNPRKHSEGAKTGDLELDPKLKLRCVAWSMHGVSIAAGTEGGEIFVWRSSDRVGKVQELSQAARLGCKFPAFVCHPMNMPLFLWLSAYPPRSQCPTFYLHICNYPQQL